MPTLIVNISNLVFHYDGDSRPLLDIPTWQLQEGERVFLQGPSGSGKTTLLNLLAGILTPTAGSIEVRGQSLGDMSGRKRDAWRAQHIGIVFQQFNLVPHLSPIDNLRLAKHFAGNHTKNRQPRQEEQQLLQSLGLKQDVLKRPASHLSIGQQQRVAIARALINNPELVIVDEPTSALDQANRDSFLSLLFERASQQGTAVIFVSHDDALAEHFSRVDSLESLNRAGVNR